MDEVLPVLRSVPMFELERALEESANGTSSVNKNVQDSAGEILSANLFFANVIVVFVDSRRFLSASYVPQREIYDKYLE
jgi:hypothetical protein